MTATPLAPMAGDAWQGTGTWHPGRGRVRGMNAHGRGRVRGSNRQTPRRRHILFRGVWYFLPLSVIFRAFCLEVLRNFVYLHAIRGYRYLQSPRARRVVCCQLFNNALNHNRL